MPSSSKKRTRSNSSADVTVQLYDTTVSGRRRLFYPGHFDTRDLRLVEIPAEFVDTVATGEHLKIVGDDNKNDSVLCSNNKTYSIRKVETSNQIYLVKPSSTCDFGIEGGIKEYYEIKPIIGKISRIKELLTGYDHIYDGPESEASKDTTVLLTHSELVQNIQASDHEIKCTFIYTCRISI